MLSYKIYEIFKNMQLYWKHTPTQVLSCEIC